MGSPDKDQKDRKKGQAALRVLCVWRPSVPGFRDYDFEILQRSFETGLIHFSYNPLSVLRLFSAMRRHDVAFAWFAGLHALLMVLFAKLLKKKSVIVCGGYDIARVPEIGYGMQLHPLLGRIARLALNNADLVLSISNYAAQELQQAASPRRHEMIYCCCKQSKSIEPRPKSNKVVTVGLIDKKGSLRKGHFEFVEVARYLPDIAFIHVGKAKDDTIDKLKAQAPGNVSFLGYLPDEEYARLLEESKIYLQLSKHEGFGVSVMEAMLHGVTPIVSAVGSLPEIVGDAGIVLDTSRPEAIARAISEVLRQSGDNRQARNRAAQFSCARREEALVRAIKEIARQDSG